MFPIFFGTEFGAAGRVQVAVGVGPAGADDQNVAVFEGEGRVLGEGAGFELGCGDLARGEGVVRLAGAGEGVEVD